jgi:6,7-dimethyl-8-ribityllumazine synthase
VRLREERKLINTWQGWENTIKNPLRRRGSFDVSAWRTGVQHWSRYPPLAGPGVDKSKKMAEVSNSKLFQNNTGIRKQDACVVIVRTDWNAAVVDELEKGCKKTLHAQGIESIKVITVPGAVEIPFIIHKYWELYKYKDNRPQCFIALGCVIRGGTPHFDYVCMSVTQGITRLNLDLPVPVIFGILTVDNQQQADERIGGVHGHKGEEAAYTAIKMMDIVDTLAAQKSNNNK